MPNDRQYLRKGYLLIEFMCALLLLALISSSVLYTHWNTTAAWRDSLQERAAVQLAQQHLDAALFNRKNPEKNDVYKVTIKKYSCAPTIKNYDKKYTLENLNKNFSLTSATVSWNNSHGKERSITLVSGGVVAHE